MFHVCMLIPQIVTPVREAHARAKESKTRARGVCRG